MQHSGPAVWAGFTGVKSGKPWEDQAWRCCPEQGRAVARGFPRGESAAKGWESYALIVFFSAGFVSALSDQTSVGGPFPAGSLLALILPGLSTARRTGKMPPLREGDRYFWAAPPSAATTEPFSYWRISFMHPLRPAGSSKPQLVHESAHPNVHYHSQRHEHEQHGRPAITH